MRQGKAGFHRWGNPLGLIKKAVFTRVDQQKKQTQPKEQKHELGDSVGGKQKLFRKQGT